MSCTNRALHIRKKALYSRSVHGIYIMHQGTWHATLDRHPYSTGHVHFMYKIHVMYNRGQPIHHKALYSRSVHGIYIMHQGTLHATLDRHQYSTCHVHSMCKIHVMYKIHGDVSSIHHDNSPALKRTLYFVGNWLIHGCSWTQTLYITEMNSTYLWKLSLYIHGKLPYML